MPWPTANPTFGIPFLGRNVCLTKACSFLHKVYELSPLSSELPTLKRGTGLGPGLDSQLGPLEQNVVGIHSQPWVVVNGSHSSSQIRRWSLNRLAPGELVICSGWLHFIKWPGQDTYEASAYPKVTHRARFYCTSAHKMSINQTGQSISCLCFSLKPC